MNKSELKKLIRETISEQDTITEKVPHSFNNRPDRDFPSAPSNVPNIPSGPYEVPRLTSEELEVLLHIVNSVDETDNATLQTISKIPPRICLASLKYGFQEYKFNDRAKKILVGLIQKYQNIVDKKPLKEIGNSSGPYDLLTPIEQTFLVNALNKLSKKDGGAAVTHESLVHTKIGRCIAALKDVVVNNPNLRPLEKEVIDDLTKKLSRFERISKIKKTTNEGPLPKKDALPPTYQDFRLKLEKTLYKNGVSLDKSNAIVDAVIHYLLHNKWEPRGSSVGGSIHENRNGNYPEYLYYDNEPGHEHNQITDLPDDSFAKDYIEGVSSGEFKGAVYKKIR